MGSDGKINSQVIGGMPPYTYLWSNGSTSANLVNVPAGTYSVIITDADNHQTTSSIFLYSSSAIDVDVRKTEMGILMSRAREQVMVPFILMLEEAFNPIRCFGPMAINMKTSVMCQPEPMDTR